MVACEISLATRPLDTRGLFHSTSGVFALVLVEAFFFSVRAHSTRPHCHVSAHSKDIDGRALVVDLPLGALLALFFSISLSF